MYTIIALIGKPDGGEETKTWTFEAGQSVLRLADQGAQGECWKHVPSNQESQNMK